MVKNMHGVRVPCGKRFRVCVLLATCLRDRGGSELNEQFLRVFVDGGAKTTQVKELTTKTVACSRSGTSEFVCLCLSLASCCVQGDSAEVETRRVHEWQMIS